MQRKAFKMVVLLTIIAMIGSACTMQITRSTPPARSDYVSLPFKKVINPAFIDEVENKWFKSEVRFYMVINQVMDLPREYRNDYVRIMVMDPEGSSAGTRSVVVPKEESDIVFDLKIGDIIEIFAYAQPLIVRSGITGAKQRKILLVVENIEKWSDPLLIKPVVGTYVSEKNSKYYMELKADGTFFVKDPSGQGHGEYAVKGSTITLKMRMRQARGTIEGNVLIDPDGDRWIKQ